MPTPAQLTQGNYNSLDTSNQINDGHFIIGYNGNSVAGSERRYSVGDLKKYINHDQIIHGHGTASAEGGQITLCSSAIGEGIEETSWNFDAITRNITANTTITSEWVRVFSRGATGMMMGTQEGRWYFATDGQIAEQLHQEWNGVVTVAPRFLRSMPGGETTQRWRNTTNVTSGTVKVFQWLGTPSGGGLTAGHVGLRIAAGKSRLEPHDRTALGVITAVSGDTVTVDFDRNAASININGTFMLFRSDGGLSVKGYATSDDIVIDNLKVENNSTWSLNNPSNTDNRITIDPTGNGDFNSQVDGRHVLGKITTRELDVTVGETSSGNRAEVNIIGRGTSPTDQASARLFAGQSENIGFGLLYNADDNPNEIGTSDEAFVYLSKDQVDTAVMKWKYISDAPFEWSASTGFRGMIRVNDPTFTLPAFACDVNGDVRASGNIIAQSDERYKTDITPVLDSIDTIKRLSGVKYVKKQTGKMDYGLVAQQVEEVLPELVVKHSGDKYMDERSINYNGVIPVLIEAIKAQQVQIERLQQRSSK